LNQAACGSLEQPPLSLYVHLPWCVRKCPYCDFNSHAISKGFPADDYVSALLTDLQLELPLVGGRPVSSIFFGGGTPSLFTAQHYDRLLGGFRALLPLSPQLEVTLEANPGAVEYDSFAAYRQVGINRISLGVQSFDDASLRALGRIHGRADVLRAVESLHRGGCDNFNIDLMFALPGQGVEAAVRDAQSAIDCAPAHISHYQLTIEPNTAFHAEPPVLPSAEAAWEMQEVCAALLQRSGLQQYEVSAWAKPGSECRHNLNYWHFGDYLGIGAGAHGKVTLAGEQVVKRRVRVRHPTAWLKAVAAGSTLAEERVVSADDRVFEFFLNQLRLRQGVRKSEFEARTGLPWPVVAERVGQLRSKGLVTDDGERLVPTELGWRFVNESQALFLP